MEFRDAVRRREWQRWGVKRKSAGMRVSLVKAVRPQSEGARSKTEDSLAAGSHWCMARSVHSVFESGSRKAGSPYGKARS